MYARRNLVTLLLPTLAAMACETPAGPMPEGPAATLSAGVVASATGSGITLAGGEIRVASFSVIKRADGRVSGQFQIDVKVLGVSWHTNVECLTVVGNMAFLGGTVTRSSGPPVTVGSKSYFWVRDNGTGQNDTADEISVANLNETQQGLDDFCNLVQNQLPARTVVQGNVHVRG